MGLVRPKDGFDFLAIVPMIEDVDVIAIASGRYADDDVALFAGKGVAEDGAWRVGRDRGYRNSCAGR